MSRQRVPNKMLQDLVDVSALHTTSALYPSAGAGLELYSYPPTTPTQGMIQSFDRTAAAWLDLAINAKNLSIVPQGSNSKLFIGNYSTPPFFYPLGSGSLSIESPAQYLMLHSKSGTHLGGNAYWDGTNWYRYDTASAAALVIVASSAIYFWTAPAGTGPISWAQNMNIAQATGLLTADTWHTVTYQNGFSAYSGWNDVQYMRTPAGEVRFRGLLGSPTTAWGHGTAAFTMPVGYRLAYEPGSSGVNYHHFPILTDSALGGVTIWLTGMISPWFSAGGVSSGAHWWDFSDISYMAV